MGWRSIEIVVVGRVCEVETEGVVLAIAGSYPRQEYNSSRALRSIAAPARMDRRPSTKWRNA